MRATRIKVKLTSPKQLTRFEKHSYVKRYQPVVGELPGGKQTVIGYYKSTAGYYELRDREGKIVWSDEKSIEPSLISPVDFVPGVITGVFKGLASVLRNAIAIRIGGTVAGAGRGVASRAVARLARALKSLKDSAARLLSRLTADSIKGPLGTVSREVLEKAAASSGSTVTVVTRLTKSPQARRALSVAFGENAQAIAEAARTVGQTFTAKIPKELIAQLQKVGLVEEKIVRMAGTVGKEYRFLANATEFIVGFFK